MEALQATLQRLFSMRLLPWLLKDKTTKRNIIWGTDAYAEYGAAYGRDMEIAPELLLDQEVLQTRAQKEKSAQTERTRQHAEVFTPLWICEKMNNHIDDVWFGKSGAFDDERVEFGKRKWQHYVDSRRLEITCGEAPFLVSRYDVATGETIPIAQRVGLLDRKLRVVNENVSDEKEWFCWIERAFMSIYGYEFQGDNLLIARINLMLTLEEAVLDRWQRKPTEREYKRILRVIVYNIWQMDGLTGSLPYSKAEPEWEQMSMDMFIDMPLCAEPAETLLTKPMCVVYDWRGEHRHQFTKVREGSRKMKFDFIIGNPPYQDIVGESENKEFAPPIYNKFLDAAYDIADRVEMIHPARFLRNAGSTPKEWNKKMLEDSHLCVLYFEQSSSKIFANTDIKGGVVITYRDIHKDFGAIGTFVPYVEMYLIIEKVAPYIDKSCLRDIVFTQNRFDLNALYVDFPELKNVIGSAGHDKRFRNNIFDKVNAFTTTKANIDDIAVIGVIKNKRNWRYIRRKYVDFDHENLKTWKVILPRANGSGDISDVLSSPVVIAPFEGYTQTFIGIGSFETREEAENTLKYIKTKFARVMLGILKTDQHNEKETWKYVPLQDFTPSSDIDWTRSIPEIDQQLYAKYGLSPEEIAFIDTHVKEMQ